jgi:hypothetical protein
MKKLLPILAGLALIIGLAVLPYLLEQKARRAADRSLQAQPVYQVIKRYEPTIYERLLDKHVATKSGESASSEYVNFANATLSETATQRLAHASDAAVNALIRDMLRNAQALARKPGDQCFRFLFPQVAGPPDVASQIDAAAQARTLELLAEVIRSAHESPQPLPEAAAVQDKLASVVNAIYEQYGSDAQMIAHTEDPRIDRTKVCTMTLSLYERIIAWPPADSSALIRAMTQVQ